MPHPTPQRSLPRLLVHRFTALLLALAGAALTPAPAQQTVEERDDVRERGIHRVTEWRLPLEEGEVAAEAEPWGYWEYDRRGNLVVTGRFVAAGVDSPMYVREYDAEDRPVRRTWYCDRTPELPGGRPCLVFRGYRLDDHGNVAEETGYDFDGNFVVRATFVRDAAGRPLEREDFFGDGSEKNRSYRYRYTEQGDVAEMETYDAAGELIEARRTEYVYDAQGRVVEWTSSDADGSVTGDGRNRYDLDGNRIESVMRDGIGRRVRHTRYTYELWD